MQKNGDLPLISYFNMNILARGQLINVSDTVNLTATFRDANGNPANTDTFPTISLVSPDGLVLLMPSSAGVMQLTTGVYEFSYTLPIGAALGVYNDIWVGFVNGVRNDQTLSFVVFGSNLPGNTASEDGYYALGDDPGFDYSQTAIQNINKLMKAVRMRLASQGKTKTTDANGNVIYVDCDIFSVEQLTTFIATSLTEFNMVPYLTQFRFEDTDIIEQFFAIIVEGAYLLALAARALVERGNEWVLSDNGASLNLPAISSLMQEEFNAQFSAHVERIKFIKNSLRPAPRNLGIISAQTSAPLVLRRLTTLRARRVF